MLVPATAANLLPSDEDAMEVHDKWGALVNVHVWADAG